jgi:hypothetical protein
VRRALIALALVLPACVIGRRALRLPPDDGVPTLMVLSGAMPEPIRRVGRHAWFLMREDGAHAFTRWECCSPGPNSEPPFDMFGGGNVILHGVFRGARAQKMMACIEKKTKTYEYAHEYHVWPGPNSNTYVEAMLRRCGVHVDLPATCVGRDYRGALGASVTSGGTGFQIESPVVGLKLGLTEGVEVHLFGLAFGVDLWPPAIILPFEGGRLGFEDW